MHSSSLAAATLFAAALAALPAHADWTGKGEAGKLTVEVFLVKP